MNERGPVQKLNIKPNLNSYSQNCKQFYRNWYSSLHIPMKGRKKNDNDIKLSPKRFESPQLTDIHK